MLYEILLVSILLVFGVPAIQVSHAQDDLKLEWVKRSEINISDITPGGFQFNTSMVYIARGHYNNSTIPGKYHVDADGQIHTHVDISYEGKEIRANNFEILKYPPEAVSWIPGNGESVDTQYAILGGIEGEEELYICRALVPYENQNFLLVGKFGVGSAVCSVPLAGEALEFPDFELLMLNWYGIEKVVSRSRVVM